jgi:hypothetical protein
MLRYILKQRRLISQQRARFMDSDYVVVWSGTMEKQQHDAQLKPAPDLGPGSAGRPRPAGFETARDEDKPIDLR